MQIESLYVYPVKSFRGISLDTATLTKHGFPHDRKFMVLQVVKGEDGSPGYKNMSVAHYNEMVRFFQSWNLNTDTLTVTHKPVDGSAEKTIDIPLVPDTTSLEQMEVLMHKSPTAAYNMGATYNDWLTSCFGYECILAYIGEHAREVRFESTGYNKPTASGNANTTGWFSSLASIATKATGMVVGNSPSEPQTITFSDVAPYLIVSSKSMDDVHHRLPADEEFDITKFRPNVVVSGANKPWEEDFWGELTINGHSKVACAHNCNRCTSINVDYNTGAQGTSESGKMLKMLSKDRRVDIGAKYAPVFGRYSFLHPESVGDEIQVGDEVVVSRWNEEHTAFGAWAKR